MNDFFLHNIKYDMKDGIPIYSPDRYWGKVPAAELSAAIELIDNNGWDEFGRHYKNKFDFTFDEDSADWRFNAPLDNKSVVLDIGAGMGRSAIPLARVARKVVAFDQSVLRMRFLKRLAEKNGLRNMEMFVGDIFDLPLRPSSFDLIAMNGILEWVGKADKFSNPRAAQIACLRICRDLLKPGGCLYVGIENRFAFSYLRGLDHSGLRYTSYLPRKFANFYTKMRVGKKYDTYTYTKKGYEKLFREAGFESMNFYLVYPGYNKPKISIPYNNLSILRFVVQSLMPSTGWRRRLVRIIANFYPFLSVYRKLFFSFNIMIKK